WYNLILDVVAVAVAVVKVEEIEEQIRSQVHLREWRGRTRCTNMDY
nr:hypothetical protein [Tanacetum cinerariifolium]